MLREVGGDEQVTALADRIAAYASALDHPGAAARLLDALRAFGAPEQVATVLADRAAAHASLDEPGRRGRLLRSLPKAAARAGHRAAAP